MNLIIVFKQLLNAGEDVLVFYNDNKASFQQFVEMMRNERDRQYREDVQMMVDLGGVTDYIVKDKQQPINNRLGPTTQNVEGTTMEDSLQQEGVESEYEDNDSHGALRFVCLSI